MNLGSLHFCNVADASVLNGQTVDQFLAIANNQLGGGAAPFGTAVTALIARQVNEAFVDGVPSPFAQESLRVGGCGWTNGEMRTFTQFAYGDPTTAGGAVLISNYNSLYGVTDLVVGGINTMRFTSATAVFTYLPAIGAPASLSGNLLNPLTSSSGEFGGQVLALQLNVDFSGSGAIPSAMDLGSLYICNYALVPQVNGQTVDQFLTTANSLLGGGSASFGSGAASIVATEINSAFINGVPSPFAQSNLFDGACPLAP